MENQERTQWSVEKTNEVLGILRIKKMTQLDLAAEINCSKTYLNEVLNCKRIDPFIEMALDCWVRENK